MFLWNMLYNLKYATRIKKVLYAWKKDFKTWHKHTKDREN